MGRPAGASNKNKRGLKAQLKQEYGDDFNVILMMGEHCVTLHKIAVEHAEGLVSESTDGNDYIDASRAAKTAIESLEKLAQYVEPKLKAIEHTGGIDTTLTVVRKEYKPSKS